jgi:uncharacterized glyoxalase superfamily protein PhnB
VREGVTIMEKKPRAITQINIVAERFEETLRFYRLLGLEIPDPITQPPGALHAPANTAAGVAFELDNAHLARIYNAGWRRSTGSSSVLLSVSVDSREEVDATYARLVAAGYKGRQPPYDAFWGSRFAVLADPEGNDVGLISPADERYRSWPPANSPAR